MQRWGLELCSWLSPVKICSRCGQIDYNGRYVKDHHNSKQWLCLINGCFYRRREPVMVTVWRKPGAVPPPGYESLCEEPQA